MDDRETRYRISEGSGRVVQWIWTGIGAVVGFLGGAIYIRVMDRYGYHFVNTAELYGPWRPMAASDRLIAEAIGVAIGIAAGFTLGYTQSRRRHTG